MLAASSKLASLARGSGHRVIRADTRYVTGVGGGWDLAGFGIYEERSLFSSSVRV